MGSNHVDVIIVGAGGSGLAAAVSCGEQGLKTIVLEACPQTGGTTGIAVGSFTAAETEHQRKAGVRDSSSQHAVDLANFAPKEIEKRNNARAREFFTEHAAETLEWLQSHGVKFVGPAPEPPNSQPRMHNVIPGAKAYVAKLQLAARKVNARIQTHSTVTELLIESGRVLGVEYQSQDGKRHQLFADRGVVLATGDYANNPELIKRFKGPGYEKIEGINPHACGLGHLLAEQAGANLVNMDVTYGPELRFISTSVRPFQQWLPVSGPLAAIQALLTRCLPDWIFKKIIKRLLVTWQHPESSLFDEGAILVNHNGQRFCDETCVQSRNLDVSNQPEGQAFILLGPAQTQQFSNWPHFISTAPDIAYAYVEDYLRLRPDISYRADNLLDLASLVTLPYENLKATAEQAFESGDQGPWVILGPVKSYFTTTEGSAVINQAFQVMDRHDKVIPGLFAIGQCGLNGMILWSHGCHIAWAMTSGRLVGKSL